MSIVSISLRSAATAAALAAAVAGGIAAAGPASAVPVDRPIIDTARLDFGGAFSPEGPRAAAGCNGTSPAASSPRS